MEQVSIVAAVSTLTAVALILLGYFLDANECHQYASYPEFTPAAASNSLATIIFAYGGHPCLPTIVHDMKTPQHFFRCFLLSYIALFLLYTPVSLLGFWIYGDSVSDSIISSIQNDSLRRAISILIAIHVFFSILIIVNPLLQASEHVFGVKQEFGFGRFVTRTIVFWVIILSAASVPNFGIVVNLVGGSTLPLLVLIFPPLFAMFLEVRQKLEQDGAKEEFSLKSIWHYHPKPRLLLDILIIALGFYVMFHSTYHSVSSLFFSENPPTRSCFATWFSSTSSDTFQNSTTSISSHSSHFQCCGAFRNISLSESHRCF
uniref:Aa_trans domain-containing protein n=1 Tax=Caenorhabditis japonica TaxID=281687 RepID=A0A8R1HPH0_CAEJA